jgi:hypothetical protein
MKPNAVLLRLNFDLQKVSVTEPLPPDVVLAGPLKRPNEIGFKEGFDLIEFLLVFRRQLFVHDRVPLRHPGGGS